MKATIALILFSFLGISFPDTDFLLFPILSHRSIITHSIIVPYFVYNYLRKKEKFNSQYLDLIYSGFLIGVGIHLIADLFPKAYMGFALIKLPFHISIGAGPSIIWILLNIFLSFKIALDKAKFNLNKDVKKTYYFATLSVITIIYLLSEYNPATKIAFFFVTLIIAWIYIKKNKPKKIVKEKQEEIPTKKIKKKSGSTIKYIVTFFLVFLIGTIFLLENYSDPKKGNMFIKKKESWRSIGVKQDEFDLCKNELIKKYPKKKFTKINFSSSKVSDKYPPFEKTIFMWMNHKVLFVKKYFGRVDCKIRINKNESISFVSLSDKYKGQ